MSIKTILITGATSGIGLALFEKYVALGHQVIACGRDEKNYLFYRLKPIKLICLILMMLKALHSNLMMLPK